MCNQKAATKIATEMVYSSPTILIFSTSLSFALCNNPSFINFAFSCFFPPLFLTFPWLLLCITVLWTCKFNGTYVSLPVLLHGHNKYICNKLCFLYWACVTVNPPRRNPAFVTNYIYLFL